MADFFNAAFPWIAMGIAFALVTVYMDSKNKKQNK
jgi:hypothetical protein